VMVDIMKGENKSPEHLTRQPFGQIPALEDEGFELFESRAMMRYIDQKLSGTSLTPSDPKARARMDQWMSVEQSNFTPHAMKVIMQTMFVPLRGGTPDQEIIKAGRAETERCSDILDKALSKQEYIAGGTFSLGDISFMPYIEYLFAAQAGDIITARPSMAAWWKRISERASWKTATGK
jgi:glutathione S-transferase